MEWQFSDFIYAKLNWILITPGLEPIYHLLVITQQYRIYMEVLMMCPWQNSEYVHNNPQGNRSAGLPLLAPAMRAVVKFMAGVRVSGQIEPSAHSPYTFFIKS